MCPSQQADRRHTDARTADWDRAEVSWESQDRQPNSGLSCWCFSALSRGFQVRPFTYTSIYILHYLLAIFHFQGDDRVRHSDRRCRIEEGVRGLEPARAVTRNFLSTDTQTANICVFRGQRSSNSGVRRVQPVCEAVCVEGCQGVVATVASG